MSLFHKRIRLKDILSLLPDRIIVQTMDTLRVVDSATALNQYGKYYVTSISPRGYDVEVILYIKGEK